MKTLATSVNSAEVCRYGSEQNRGPALAAVPLDKEQEAQNYTEKIEHSNQVAS